MPTICLNMIVKNESQIITRLFDSIISIIDCYCICDTGSTDNTINIIKNYFEEKNIPGKIIQEPFVHFSHNRNLAISLCEGIADYLLLLDADMIVQLNNFDKQSLSNYNHFYIFQGNNNFYYKNIRIIKNNGKYNYVGSTHEYISTSDNNSYTINKNIFFIYDVGDGGCKYNKFQRDVELLTNSIHLEPNNSRNYFYLANTYYDIQKYNDAIEYYKKRIELKGWEQEVWYSYYKIGLSYLNLNNFSSALFYWLEAYDCFPNRIENIYEIVKYYRINSKHKLAYHFYKLAVSKLNLKKDDWLFLHNDIYNYKLYFEFIIIAYYNNIKNVDNEFIYFFNSSTDENMNKCILSNLKFYNSELQVIPFKIKNFNDTVIHNGIHFYSSSSCLIKKCNSNNYLMNVRYVNYKINCNGSYNFKNENGNGNNNKNENQNNNIISLNKFIELDTDFNFVKDFFIQNETTIDEETITKINTNNNFYKYIGIEDLKLFNFQNNTFFIGTDYNYQTNKIGISYGLYDYEINKKINAIQLNQNFSNTNCEKNWIFTTNSNNQLCIIYEWLPLVICAIEENNIVPIITKNMPPFFKLIRGSTCESIDLETGDKWFICHFVSHENPRHYYHIFVVLDINFNLLRYSAPFTFKNEPIEYCLSILIENNYIFINFSTWDRTTSIGIYNKNYINSFLQYSP